MDRKIPSIIKKTFPGMKEINFWLFSDYLKLIDFWLLPNYRNFNLMKVSWKLEYDEQIKKNQEKIYNFLKKYRWNINHWNKFWDVFLISQFTWHMLYELITWNNTENWFFTLWRLFRYYWSWNRIKEYKQLELCKKVKTLDDLIETVWKTIANIVWDIELKNIEEKTFPFLDPWYVFSIEKKDTNEIIRLPAWFVPDIFLKTFWKEWEKYWLFGVSLFKLFDDVDKKPKKNVNKEKFFSAEDYDIFLKWFKWLKIEKLSDKKIKFSYDNKNDLIKIKFFFQRFYSAKEFDNWTKENWELIMVFDSLDNIFLYDILFAENQLQSNPYKKWKKDSILEWKYKKNFDIQKFDIKKFELSFINIEKISTWKYVKYEDLFWNFKNIFWEYRKVWEWRKQKYIPNTLLPYIVEYYSKNTEKKPSDFYTIETLNQEHIFLWTIKPQNEKDTDYKKKLLNNYLEIGEDVLIIWDDILTSKNYFKELKYVLNKEQKKIWYIWELEVSKGFSLFVLECKLW